MSIFRREHGQTIPLVAIFMVVLVGAGAVAIDVGVWYQSRRDLQSDTDAAALAAAVQLPTSWTSATTAGNAQFAKNGKAGDSVAFTQSTTYRTNDSITVTATREEDSFLARVFGIDDVTVKTTAKAVYDNPAGGAAPWGVMKGTYVPGTTYPIYTDNSSPNNGALRLDVWNGNTCGVNLGGSTDYRESIIGTNQVCPLALGQIIDPKTGQNSGPTRQGIDNRITSFQPLSSIVTFAGGTATLLQPGSPQLVLIPVVENAQTGGTTWPQGSGTVRVVGFAWFVVTGYSDNGRQVDAVYVGPAATDPSTNPGLPAAFSPTLSG